MARPPASGRPRPGRRGSGRAAAGGGGIPGAGTRPAVVERGLGGQVVAGRQRGARTAGRRAAAHREIWFGEGLDPAPILDEITALAARAGVPIRRVPRSKLERLADTEAPQGVVARAAPLPEADLTDLATGRVGRRRSSSPSTA